MVRALYQTTYESNSLALMSQALLACCCTIHRRLDGPVSNKTGHRSRCVRNVRVRTVLCDFAYLAARHGASRPHCSSQVVLQAMEYAATMGASTETPSAAPAGTQCRPMHTYAPRICDHRHVHLPLASSDLLNQLIRAICISRSSRARALIALSYGALQALALAADQHMMFASPHSPPACP